MKVQVMLRIVRTNVQMITLHIVEYDERNLTRQIVKFMYKNGVCTVEWGRLLKLLFKWGSGGSYIGSREQKD